MRITDGHPTLLTFELAPGIKLWTAHVQPPGLSGGGPNDITVMENQVMRTRAPKHLITATEANLLVHIDPSVYDDIMAMINLNQVITVIFPDTSAVLFYGWLDEFRPNPFEEGKAPDVNIKVEPSNITNDDPPIEFPIAYSPP